MSLGEGKYTRLIDKWSRKFWMNFPKNEFPPLSRAESRKSVFEILGKVPQNGEVALPDVVFPQYGGIHC